MAVSQIEFLQLRFDPRQQPLTTLSTADLQTGFSKIVMWLITLNETGDTVLVENFWPPYLPFHLRFVTSHDSQKVKQAQAAKLECAVMSEPHRRSITFPEGTCGLYVIGEAVCKQHTSNVT